MALFKLKEKMFHNLNSLAYLQQARYDMCNQC